MRLFFLLVAALILTSACNLNTQPATPTAAPQTTTTATIIPASTAAPTDTLLPGVIPTSGATRTPFGNQSAPTTQPIGTPGENSGAFPIASSGERAEITSPTSGATVSANPLYVSGIVYNLPEDSFTLQVFDSSGQSITPEQAITLSNPNHVAQVPWSASVMVRGYTGSAQIRISAKASDGSTVVIGAANVTITPATASAVQATSSSANGASGSISSPTNGSAVSGDPITVTGTAGGITENQFTLLLLDGSGTVLNSQLITLTGADQYAVPWSASMGTSGYRGSAEIRAVVVRDGQQVTIASATVTLQ